MAGENPVFGAETVKSLKTHARLAKSIAEVAYRKLSS